MIVPLALLSAFFFEYAMVYGQYASRFPEPIPLFHKTPYFNVWLPANDSMYNQGYESVIMPNAFVVDWAIAVRVDGTAYLLQGSVPKFALAKTVGAYITSTQTLLTMDAGPLRVNITYLTPIELDDWILHSLPFVYVAVDIWSTDGKPHSIQLYSGVGGQFLSSNTHNKMTWNTTVTSKSIYHQAQQSIFQTLTEANDMSEDGTQYFAVGTISGASVTWQVSSDYLSHNNFTIGKLTNTSETNFRSIDNNWPFMAFALDFGSTSQILSPAIFALGLVRDPVMRYVKDGTQTRSSLWWIRWSDVGQAIDTFLTNFPSALSHAIALDNKIVSDASVISSKINLPSAVTVNLTDLMILSLRQTIGSLEFTTLRSFNGELADNWRVFMKDLGNTRRVNPVDILYASFPAFLYLDPSLAGKLLEPLLEFQAHDNTIYAAPDLGVNWPLVIGNNLDQYYFGVENCGSMLVMVLAHAQKSGDGKLIATYYDVLQKWADFLVTNSLQHNEYTTSVDTGAGVISNLALKGIMGIYAMAQINRALNYNPNVTAYYLNIAKSQVQQWEGLLLSTDHIMSVYGNTTSWGLLFNLYASRLLGADIIPETIYETQAKWYSSHIAQAPSFGLPLDSSQPNLIKASWTLFTAASIFNSTTSNARDALISMVHSRSFPLSTVVRNDANPSTYSADTGASSSGIANPAMGAVFAFLALNTPNMDIVLPSSSSSPHSSLLGGVLGGVAALILVLIIAYFLFKKRKKYHQDTGVTDTIPDESRPLETIYDFTGRMVDDQRLLGRNAQNDGMSLFGAPPNTMTILNPDPRPAVDGSLDFWPEQ